MLRKKVFWACLWARPNFLGTIPDPDDYGCSRGQNAIEVAGTPAASKRSRNPERKYAAMKYLFEAIGLFPAPMQEESPAEDSVALTLLRRLGLPEDPTPETNVKPGREPDSATHAGDAVE
jgi:hypothetical protein